jgi:RNA binding activity-knot of a chromodomain.
LEKALVPGHGAPGKDGVHLIHYTEYDAKWDEWVPSRRIREPKP